MALVFLVFYFSKTHTTHTQTQSLALKTNVLFVSIKQLHTFGPMDYESLQQELALKAPLWKKVSPTESHEDSSTTVVYRMDTVAK